jgi:hypothetical protein
VNAAVQGIVTLAEAAAEERELREKKEREEKERLEKEKLEKLKRTANLTKKLAQGVFDVPDSEGLNFFAAGVSAFLNRDRDSGAGSDSDD